MNLTQWWASRWARMRGWFNRRGAARTGVLAGSSKPGAEQPREWKEVYGRIARVATHALPEEDRRMQLCCCSVCGVVRVCTPDFDFYSQRPGGPLMCQVCFYQLVVHVQCRGVTA